MIIHLFNSSSVSGPERLVLPALANYPDEFMIVNLLERRIDRLREVDPLKEYSRSLDLRYISIPVNSRWDDEAIRELRRLMERLNPDLVHAHAIKASVYLYQATRKGQPCRFPIVSTHHGAHGLPDWKVRVYEWLYRKLFLKDFDRILCVSSADYEFVSRTGIGTEKLRLHRNGVNGHRVFVNQRDQESRKVRALWFPEDAHRDRHFLFGTIGRLSSEKDHMRLLNVLFCLNQCDGERDWKCLIFGVGELKNKLNQQVSRLGLEKRIVWMGYRSDVGNELSGLDVVLSFSKAEGLPINLIEAGWAGTAVMSTWVGGVKDLIPHSHYGVTVSPEERPLETARRMQPFFTDEGRAELRHQGEMFQERVVKEFTQESWIKRLAEIYGELNVGFEESWKTVRPHPLASSGRTARMNVDYAGNGFYFNRQAQKGERMS